jgi:hypothetical protein
VGVAGRQLTAGMVGGGKAVTESHDRGGAWTDVGRSAGDFDVADNTQGA